MYSEEAREAAIVKFCVLASGSSGNAALLATENTCVLVDAGLSMRELGKRLASIGEDPERIFERLDAILITHEHSDHVAGLPVLARSKKIRAHFERIRQGNPERKRIALVATAHYLLRVMLAMLRTGEVWRAEAA